MQVGYEKNMIFDQYLAYWWSVECCQQIRLWSMLITASIDFVYISGWSRHREQNRIYLYTLVKATNYSNSSSN